MFYFTVRRLTLFLFEVFIFIPRFGFSKQANSANSLPVISALKIGALPVRINTSLLTHTSERLGVRRRPAFQLINRGAESDPGRGSELSEEEGILTW